MGETMSKRGVIAVLIAALFSAGSARAGLPPTTSKGIGDASNLTTFNYQFNGFSLSHSGVTATIGPVAGSNGEVMTSDGTRWTSQTSAAAAAAPTTGYDALNVAVGSSLGGSAITLTLKQASGSDCSSGTSACKIGFRSSVSSSGVYNQRSVTAALSITVASGTTLGMPASQSNNLWIYGIDSDGAGAVKLGVSTVQYDEGSLQSTVKESSSATATFASPCVFTVNGHGYSNGDKVRITGTPPSGFSTGQDYHVVSAATNTFQLSATIGGTAVNSGSTGTNVVINIAGPKLVSDAVYTSKPVRLIGRAQFNLPTPGTWLTPTYIATGIKGSFPQQVVAAWFTLSSDQTGITSGVSTKATLDTASMDSVGFIDTQHNRLNILQDGTYEVGYQCHSSPTTGAAGIRGIGFVYKNGSQHLAAEGSSIATTGANHMTSVGENIQNYVAGDYLELYCYATASAGTVIINSVASGGGISANTYLKVRRIP